MEYDENLTIEEEAALASQPIDGLPTIEEKKSSSETESEPTPEEKLNSFPELKPDPTPEEKKKSRIKKFWMYFAFITFNVAAILVTLLLENKDGDVIAGREAISLLGENWAFTLIALLCFVVQIACDTISYLALTKQVGIKRRFGLSLNTAIIGKYYDKITPWSTGGQPAQMAYLSTHGLKLSDGCSLPLVRSIIKVFSVGITVVAVLTAGAFLVDGINAWLMVAAYISIAGTLAFPFFFIFLMRHPDQGDRLTKWIIRLLVKIKIVKDYDKLYNKFSKQVADFLGGMKYLSTHRSVIVVIAITTLVDLFVTNSVPYFIIRAFGIREIEYWHTIMLCFYVSYASYFAPTPGSAGLAELSFYAIFAAVISDSLIFWAMLFWRIIIFYIPILVGAVMQVTEGVKTAVRKKRKA